GFRPYFRISGGGLLQHKRVAQPHAETARAQFDNLDRMVSFPGGGRQGRYLLGLLQGDNPIQLVFTRKLKVVGGGGHRGLLCSRSTSVLRAQKRPLRDAHAKRTFVRFCACVRGVCRSGGELSICGGAGRASAGAGSFRSYAARVSYRARSSAT